MKKVLKKFLFVFPMLLAGSHNINGATDYDSLYRQYEQQMAEEDRMLEQKLREHEMERLIRERELIMKSREMEERRREKGSIATALIVTGAAAFVFFVTSVVFLVLYLTSRKRA